MDDFVLLETTETTFSSLDRRMIRSKISQASEDRDITVNKQNLNGKSNNTLFDLKYRWNIKPGEEGYDLTERIYIERRWFDTFLFSVLGLAVGLMIAAIIPENPNPGSILIYLILGVSGPFFLLSSVWLVGVTLTAYLYYSGLVPDLRGSTEGYNSYSPFTSHLIIVSVAVLNGIVGYFLDVFWLMTLTSFFLFVLFVILVYDPAAFSGLSHHLSSSNIYSNIPVIVGEYILTLVPALGPLILSIIIYPWLNDSVEIIISSILIFVLYAVAQLRWVTWLVSGRSVLNVFYDVRQNQRKISNTLLRATFFSITVLLSYVAFALLIIAADRYAYAIFVNGEYLLLDVLFFSALLPLLYFGVGLFYQTIMGIREKVILFSRSSQLAENFDISATVLKLESKRLSPATLSTGLNHYVFIPDQVYQRLDRRELEAIIAHEQKHVQTGEGFYFFLMPILSLLCLTGQNVLYSLFDFREREYAADKFAKDQVGEEPLISALKKLSQMDSKKGSPTMWQDQFGMFFGTFARSEAHPPVQKRIDQIESTH